MEIFPLLQLPFVALKEVLSTWKPFDLINFSLVSRTTKRITKSIKKPKSHRTGVRLTFAECLSISIYAGGVRYVYEITTDKAQHNQQRVTVKYNYVRKTVRKCFETGLAGYFEWCDHVLDVLNWKIEDVIIYTNVFRADFEILKSTIDWLLCHTKTVKFLEIDGRADTEPVDELVSYFFNKITVTERLSLFGNLSENLAFNVPNVSQGLQVASGKWIRMSEILDMNTRDVSIGTSSFSNHDMKLLIKRWMMAESNLNLRFFWVAVQNEHSFSAIFDDLKNEAMRPESIILKEQETIEIIRIDGKRAEVTPIRHNNDSFIYFTEKV